MKTYNFASGLNIYLFFGILLSTNKLVCADYSRNELKTKVVANLKFVFTNEANPKNKDILKLYDDLTYEFLFFEFFNKKPRVKREKGTYSLKHHKLILKNKGSSQPKKHSNRFLIKEEQGLFECNLFGIANKDESPNYSSTIDNKYWQKTYKDSVFGEINNDKKANRKIIEVRPVYVPVINESGISSRERLKSESDIIDLTLISRDSLRKLKAIIIVGSVEYLTASFISEQQKTTAYLRSVGVQVVEFFHPYAIWKDIVKESEGAHIFIYSGHGTASLLCLTDGIVYGSTIVEELKLHKNALVFFNHACQSAGSSASDKVDIGKAEALKRVGDYAKPYIDLNAGAYFANNYYNCLPSFLNSFFQRTKMKDLYTKVASNYAEIEVIKKYNFDVHFDIGISSNKSVNLITEYNVAYVGKPNFTVSDLFK